MKRFSLCALIIAILLSLCACGIDWANETPEAPAATESSDALSALRADMKPPVMAVAHFGFPELSDDFGIMDYLMDEYPKWLEAHDFIRNIPQERIVLTSGYDAWGQLLCIVPRDPDSTVAVNVTTYLDHEPYEQETVAYRSESGDPILLLADTSDNVEVSVVVTDSEGRGVTWLPYWGTAEPIPEDGYYGALVMEFTPVSEKSAYEAAVDIGWLIPDRDSLADSSWYSYYGYCLDLYDNPGQGYDGDAFIYEDDGTGIYETAYQGRWAYSDGMLHLELENLTDSTQVIRGDFPVLADPFGGGWLDIFRTEEGVGLPLFDEYLEYDELSATNPFEMDGYEYYQSEGWMQPDLEELTYNWVSYGYALDLMENSVPGDNTGEAAIYEIGDYGEYTQTYTGSWQYEEGLLHLSLFSVVDDGVYIDDSFPVLVFDGELWLGRSECGTGLPYFTDEMRAEFFTKSEG